MKPHVPLRIASVVTALLFAGHTMGMPWTPAKTARSAALVEEMKAYRFDVMGFTRGYWDFYIGFGITISACLLAFSVLLWQLGELTRKVAPRTARPMIAAMLLLFAALAIVDLMYFFAAPLILTVPVAACLAWAWIASA
jgi:hypothetical protein